jgi:transposase
VAVLLRMDEQIGRLEARVARQDERIAQLERRLNRSSRNSSVPPSADGPSSPPRRSTEPSGRKPGAQFGHDGHGRELPACAVDEVLEHWPASCGCGHVFCVGERDREGEPAVRQVEELPVLTVRVIEHRAHHLCCPEGGKYARAEFPEDVSGSAFVLVCKQHSSCCRCVTVSRVETWSSSAKSSSVPACRRQRRRDPHARLKHTR